MIQINRMLGSKMTRNAFWIIGGKIYQVLINLMVNVLMARYLGPANFGLINYAASLTALFTSFCTLGINSILVNELLGDKNRQGEILGSAIGMRLLSSALSVATIVALAWALNPEEPTTIMVVLIYSTTLIFQCFDTLNYWYQANLRSRIAATAAAAGYTAASAYKIILLITQKNVHWFAAFHVAEYGLTAFLLLLSYRRRRERDQPLRFSGKTGRTLLSHSYHFLLSGMMVAVYGQMDRIMLKSLLNETVVGYYSAAVSITTMWTFILAAVIDSAKPVILAQYSVDRQRFEKNMIRLYGAVIYISFAAALAITLLSKYIILILYGRDYLPARTALCILCWSTAFSYLGVARSTWLVPMGKQKYEKYIAAAGAGFNLVLNVILIPLFGINGAAAATLTTQIFTNLIAGFFFREIRRNNLLIIQSLCIWKYIK